MDNYYSGRNDIPYFILFPPLFRVMKDASGIRFLVQEVGQSGIPKIRMGIFKGNFKSTTYHFGVFADIIYKLRLFNNNGTGR